MTGGSLRTNQSVKDTSIRRAKNKAAIENNTEIGRIFHEGTEAKALTCSSVITLQQAVAIDGAQPRLLWYSKVLYVVYTILRIYNELESRQEVSIHGGSALLL